jgi:hypothetical protein
MMLGSSVRCHDGFKLVVTSLKHQKLWEYTFFTQLRNGLTVERDRLWITITTHPHDPLMSGLQFSPQFFILATDLLIRLTFNVMADVHCDFKETTHSLQAISCPESRLWATQAMEAMSR